MIIVDFTLEAVNEYLGGVEKYAGVVRAIARNEAVKSPQREKVGVRQETRFGIR